MVSTVWKYSSRTFNAYLTKVVVFSIPFAIVDNIKLRDKNIIYTHRHDGMIAFSKFLKS